MVSFEITWTRFRDLFMTSIKDTRVSIEQTDYGLDLTKA